MLVWITQLGMSVAAPLAGFTILGVWLRNRFSLGNWVVLVGIVIGLCSAVEGLRTSLKTMEMRDRKKDGEKTVSFNDHT